VLQRDPLDTRIIEEIRGSSASATFVRSMYEIVYMTRATGMRRSQRWFLMGNARCYQKRGARRNGQLGRGRRPAGAPG